MNKDKQTQALYDLCQVNDIVFKDESRKQELLSLGLAGIIHNKISQFLNKQSENGVYTLTVQNPKTKTNHAFEIDYRGGKEPSEDEKKNNIEELEEGTSSGIVELWLDYSGTPFATIRVENHLENLKIRSRDFYNYLTGKVYYQLGKIPKEQNIKTLQSIYSARAIHEGETYETHLRCAQENDVIYVDKGDKEWTVIKITPEKIEETKKQEVKFVRYRHMKQIKIDYKADIKDINKIFNHIPVQEDDRVLLRPYLVLLLAEDVSSAIKVIYGDQGSGKTFSEKKMRKLIDPSSLELLSLPKDRKELIQMVSHHYLPWFDNVSKIGKEFSDFFCRVTTGEGFSQRELYTDDEDIIRRIRRALSFNGINLAGEEPDFLDRAWTLNMERINRKERKTEQELTEEFEKDRAKITGAIFKIMEKTLSKVKEINLNELPRMADFAKWGEAVSRVLGEGKNVFLKKYFAKIEGLNKEALEASPVGLALLDYLKTNGWFEGTASELLEKIQSKAEELKINTKKGFPSAPQFLTRKLNEIKSNLQDEGYKLEHDRNENKRIIKIYPKNSVMSVRASCDTDSEPEKAKSEGFGHDGDDDGGQNSSVMNEKTMTAMTMHDDEAKNKENQGLSSENKAKNDDDDDDDDDFQKNYIKDDKNKDSKDQILEQKGKIKALEKLDFYDYNGKRIYLEEGKEYLSSDFDEQTFKILVESGKVEVLK